MNATLEAPRDEWKKAPSATEQVRPAAAFERPSGATDQPRNLARDGPATAGLAFLQLLLEPPSGATDQASDVARDDQVELLLRLLVDAPSKQISLYRRWLRERATPDSVLDVALREYEHTAREDYVVFASSLLEDFGEQAWPALRHLARSKTAECELFVRQIARCPGVSARERLAALGDIAENPHASVRSRLLECLPELPHFQRRALLQTLVHDREPEIRAQAHEDLAILED